MDIQRPFVGGYEDERLPEAEGLGKGAPLTLAVYLATRAFPKDELYGLTSQARRSSASIGGNIAEGCGRSGKREFARYLDIASGSAAELEYHLLLAGDLHFLDNSVCQLLQAKVCEVKQMLTSLLRTIRSED